MKITFTHVINETYLHELITDNLDKLGLSNYAVYTDITDNSVYTNISVLDKNAEPKIADHLVMLVDFDTLNSLYHDEYNETEYDNLASVCLDYDFALDNADKRFFEYCCINHSVTDLTAEILMEWD
jgi:hypothetical protein